MTEKELTGWELLLSPLPPDALEPLGNEAGYGAGKTAIDKAFIVHRLIHCGLQWDIEDLVYDDLPREQTRKKDDGSTYQVPGFEVACRLTLVIDGRRRPGEGGDWSQSWGDARKGAYTDAFGRAAMKHGIGLEVFMDQMTAEQRGAVEKKASERPQRGSGKKDLLTDAAKAAVKALGKEWQECPEHGNTLVARVSNGKARISCWKRAGDEYCKTVYWENQLSPEVQKAIKDAAGTPQVQAA